MAMNSRFPFFASFLLAPFFIQAAPVALVYENEEAVLNGKAVVGTVVEGGIVTQADRLPSNEASLLAASVEGTLWRASLMRIDRQLNIAVIKLNEEVQDSLLQDAHKRRSMAVKSFLPLDLTASADSPRQESALNPPSPFQLHINDQLFGSNPVELRKKLKKSKFKLNVVYKSTAPAWKFNLELESDPPLSFWKQGRRAGLQDIPRKKFKYSRQILFKPLASGKSIQIPIEVFFIDETDYVWTFRVSTPDIRFEQPGKVRFQ